MNVFWSELIRWWTCAWQTVHFVLGVFVALIVIVSLLFVSLRIIITLTHVKNPWTPSPAHSPRLNIKRMQ